MVVQLKKKKKRYSWQSISCNMTELLAKANHIGTLPSLRAKRRNNVRYCQASWDRNSAHTMTSTTELQHPNLPRNPHLGSEVQFYKYPWNWNVSVAHNQILELEDKQEGVQNCWNIKATKIPGWGRKRNKEEESMDLKVPKNSQRDTGLFMFNDKSM